jgi:class 3 adenylate cyclase
VYAIFGFCDIHHFEDVNERLGKDIMTFVNTIAAVVHTYVHDWRGQCNKNLGQAFLVVWRIGDELTLAEVLNANPHRVAAAAAAAATGGGGGAGGRGTATSAPGAAAASAAASAALKKKAQAIDLRRVPGVDVLADCALIGYTKIIAEINRCEDVLKYRQEPRLTMNGTQEFLVRMGFGLHAGWAIEGAVGSLQKVDATYLSPHVNMAARLETSSKQYGVPLLMSQNFYELMSDEGRSYCRRLDVITVKGSEVPIGIYTYDVQQNQLFAKMPILRKGPGKGNGNVNKSKKGINDPQFLSIANETSEVFEKDYDMITLRNHLPVGFKETFNEGLELYLQGDWATARGFFEKASQQMSQIPFFEKGDGPSNTLLRYMENHGWQAPSSWKGFRPLTSK